MQSYSIPRHHRANWANRSRSNSILPQSCGSSILSQLRLEVEYIPPTPLVLSPGYAPWYPDNNRLSPFRELGPNLLMAQQQTNDVYKS